MAGVPVTVPTTGSTIAAEALGTDHYQLVKLVGGQAGSSQPIPGDSSRGLMVQWTSAMPVSVSVSVSGTVSVSGLIPVSGTVTVNTAPTVAGASVTIQQGVSVSAQISGTVTVNTAPTVAGASVTIQQGASVSAQVSGTVSVLNGASVTIQQGASVAVAVSITGTTAGAAQAIQGTTGQPAAGVFGAVVRVAESAQVSGTLTVNTAPTVAGASVTVQQGISVSAVVSGTVTALGISTEVSGTVSVAGVLYSTTAPASNVSGLLVRVAGGQDATGNPVFISGTITGGNATTVVSGTVTVNTAPTVAGASVTIQQGVSVSAVVSGTVSLANVVPVTTAASVSVSGIPVWLNPTQAVSAVVSGTVTALGISTEVSGTVSVSGILYLTTAPASNASAILVRIAGGQAATGNPVRISGTVDVAGGGTEVSGTVTVNGNLSTLSTLLGTVNVNVVAGGAGGGSITTATPASNFSAQVVRLAGGQDATAPPVWVTGTVAEVHVTTTQNAATGVRVWLAPTQTMNRISTVVQVGTLLGTVDVNIAGNGVGALLVTAGAANSLVVSVADGTVQVVGQVQVSGTVNVNPVAAASIKISGVTPVTTAASVSVGGFPVWLNPTQAVSVNPGASVTIQQGASVSLPALAGVSASSTIPASNVLALPIRIVGGQDATAPPVFISGTVTPVDGASVTARVSGTVTVGNGVSVTIQQGASVSAVVSGTVTALGTVTVNGTVSVAAGASVTVVAAGTRYQKAAPGAALVWGQSGGTSSASGPSVAYSISINAMANGSGAQGTYADLGAAYDQEYNVWLQVEMGLIPTIGSVAELYLANSFDGTIWPGLVVGTATTYPATVANNKRQLGPPVVQLVAVGISSTVQRQQPVVWRPAARYVAPVLVNLLGPTIANQATASDNGFRIILEPRRMKEQDSA